VEKKEICWSSFAIYTNLIPKLLIICLQSFCYSARKTPWLE
jgi:hypothetical protein